MQYQYLKCTALIYNFIYAVNCTNVHAITKQIRQHHK